MTTSPAPAEALARLPRLRAAIDSVSEKLLTPALVIDLNAVHHNIDAFLEKIGGPKRWRPHVKTIKQGRIIRLLMKKRVRQFKCATVDELALVLDAAERVDPDGRVDVLLAYAVHRPAARVVAELVRNHEGGRVRLLADSPSHARALSDWLGDEELPGPVDILLDVDTGMHRTGTQPAGWQAALGDMTTLPHIRVAGVHGYEGHLGWNDAADADRGYGSLIELVSALPTVKKTPALIVTSGTHSYQHALGYAQLDDGPWHHEVSPGTLVLSDLRSAPAAADLGLQQAAFVVSRVIATPADGRVTLDAGSKALNPDCPAPACAVLGWPDLVAGVPSEEHRPCQSASATPGFGESVWLVPEHVCTTVNLFRQVLYVDDDRYIGCGNIDAMSRSTWVRDRRP